MRKKMFLSLGLIFVFLTQAPLIAGASACPRRAQWAFMIYVCADNNLEWCWTGGWEAQPHIIPNLLKLESVGSTKLVHFVALVDLYNETGCELIRIEKGGYTVVEAYPELNLGDPQVCIDFVNTVKHLYPAQKYLLDFWNHGGGWEYFCWDQNGTVEEIDDDWLTLPELRYIMKKVGYIDIVGFDACDMAQAEVAYELVGHAQYMVASEEYEEWEGWPYDTNAQDLVNHPYWTPRRYAAEIVVNHGEFYESLSERYPDLAEYYEWQTFSAIDIRLMPLLRRVFTYWTSAMLANIDQYREQYEEALNNTQIMWGTYYYVDMHDYMVELKLLDLDNIHLKITTKLVKIVLSKVVIANWAGNLVPDCNGLSFYWASNQTGWELYRDQYVQEATWGQATGWVNFLDAYCV